MCNYSDFLNSLSDIQVVEFIRRKYAPPASQVVASTIIAQTLPNRALGAVHPGNWPADSMYAIGTITNDRTNGNSITISAEYFTAEEGAAAVSARLLEIQQLVADGEWVLGKKCTVYEWDLGPNVRSIHQF